MSTKAHPCLTELSSIQSFLDTVSDHVRDGKMPSLDGLEKRVARLCASIESADTETQKTCLGALPDLLKRINTCENDMRRLHAVQTVASSGHLK